LTRSETELSLEDDGLPCPEVGAWTEEKHRLISLYAKLFSSGMKNKWDRRVYVDLYAGAGYSRIRATAKIIPGSPIRALMLQNPFDKYVFCERVNNNLEALKVRVKRTAERANVVFVSGDCNSRIDDILAEIPRGSRDETTLSLCFADPFDIGLKFETIRKFADARFVDFLILLALYMDANRNYERYVSEDAVKIDEFLGSTTWRDRWADAQRKAIGFPQFLATEFSASMQSLGYLETPLHRMKRVRSDDRNLPLYYIALFSRKELAFKFWDEVLKYGTDQSAFNWD
jgi:three-Cys-motif partner protein